jgi:hypothetical protein
MSYIKTGDPIIKTGCGPIIKGRWERAELVVVWTEIGIEFGIWFLGELFEEGERT